MIKKIFRLLLILIFEGIGVIIYLGGFNDITTRELSNGFFVVGMLIFLPSVLFFTRAYQVFNGFTYAMKILIVKNFRNEHPSYREYRNERGSDKVNMLWLDIIIISLIFIIISFIIG